MIEREEIGVEGFRIGRELRDRDARGPVDQDGLAVHAERRVDAARPVVDPPVVVVEGIGGSGVAASEERYGVDKLGIPHSNARDPVRRHHLLPERPTAVQAQLAEACEVAQGRADAALDESGSRSGRG